MHGRRKLSSIGLTIAVAMAVVLLVASCSGSSSKASGSKPTTAATSPPTSGPPTQVVVDPNHVKVLTGTATGTSPCEKAAPTPTSPGQVGAGSGGSDAKATATDVAASEHGERGMLQQQVLTQSERQALEGQMSQARLVAAEYPTVADAEKAGYMKSTPFVPCIGAHYTNIGLARGFDVAHPNGQPPGFAGDNDHWHQHNANGGLCLRGGLVVGGESTTREQCTAMGGRKSLLIDIWMLHAWIVPGFECTWGTFSGECPELGGRLCGNAWESPDPKDVSQCSKALSS